MASTSPSLAHFEAALDGIRRSPVDDGRLELIVRRPAEDQREALVEGALDVALGLVGDRWSRHPGSRSARPVSDDRDTQLTLMNTRVAAVLAGDPDRWQLAGDQLYVDLDLSESNLPPGTRLAVGEEAVLEVTLVPHRGCRKFSDRFGAEALRFVNTRGGRQMRLRGMYARVLTSGVVRVGDVVRKRP